MEKEQLLCACGGVLEYISSQEGKDENTGEIYNVGMYECPDCGGVFFYRLKDEAQ